jgi:hypothetical protein
MQDQETKGPTKTPNCERIAGQAYRWLDADKARIGSKGDDEKKRAAKYELRTLAVVLDEERGD